jgi:GNAT superfamily N-acetyltransferase
MAERIHPDDLRIRTFSEEVEDDVIGLVNAYTADWPYSIPIGASVFSHWRSMGDRYQPEHMLVAYRQGVPRAFLHGERTEEVFDVHLLAVAPGAVSEAMELLRQIESVVASPKILGPTHRAWRWYNGHVLGHEPVHPHWERDATEAFVRSGWLLGHAKVMLVADLSTEIHRTPCPKGYEIVETEAEPEFFASVFRFAAVHRGMEVAHCLGRHFEGLPAPGGGSVGQLGSVGTDQRHRDRGLATHLVLRSLQHLRDWGASECLVVTEFENCPALRAYENARFERRFSLNMWSKDLPHGLPADVQSECEPIQ